jgi:hypothetical protein
LYSAADDFSAASVLARDGEALMGLFDWTGP